ncbi:Uncharacterised protein [Chlamydia trachomatis]|nr:Uncharacterised protein [Chlamydia trachomatis]
MAERCAALVCVHYSYSATALLPLLAHYYAHAMCTKLYARYVHELLREIIA